MIGGIVIGVTRSDSKTHVHVAECPHYPRHGRISEDSKAFDPAACPHPDTCCVYTDEKKVRGGERVEIGIGDSLWWQSGSCYWTPKANRGRDGNKCGVDFDSARRLAWRASSSSLAQATSVATTITRASSRRTRRVATSQSSQSRCECVSIHPL